MGSASKQSFEFFRELVIVQRKVERELQLVSAIFLPRHGRKPRRPRDAGRGPFVRTVKRAALGGSEHAIGEGVAAARRSHGSKVILPVEQEHLF
jgi:hypothetical protein